MISNRDDGQTSRADSVASIAHHTDERQTENDSNDADEQSPLLSETNKPSSLSSSLSDEGLARQPNVSCAIIAASALVLLLDIVASVPIAPRLVLFEDIICRNYYGAWGSDIVSGDCKAEPVQAELALVNGWKETFDTIPGIVLFLSVSSITSKFMFALFCLLHFPPRNHYRRN